MKFRVEVEEKVWETNTYLVEAESEEDVRKNLLEGYGEGIIEMIENFPDTGEITNIRSIKPITEAAESRTSAR
jgi:DNA polymerase/3'-5' exonuclease PolX